MSGREGRYGNECYLLWQLPPTIAAPTARPAIPASVIGVSTSRLEPYFFHKLRVTWCIRVQMCVCMLVHVCVYVGMSVWLHIVGVLIMLE